VRVTISDSFRKHLQASEAASALQAACELATDAAIKVLEEQGQPQFVPADPVKWKLELRWRLSLMMAVLLSDATGQGAEIFKTYDGHRVTKEA
jgi:hypothetical protein